MTSSSWLPTSSSLAFCCTSATYSISLDTYVLTRSLQILEWRGKKGTFPPSDQGGKKRSFFHFLPFPSFFPPLSPQLARQRISCSSSILVWSSWLSWVPERKEGSKQRRLSCWHLEPGCQWTKINSFFVPLQLATISYETFFRTNMSNKIWYTFVG